MKLFKIGMDDSSKEVRSLLTSLMNKSITAEEQGIDKAGDREISMALFGTLRYMYCTSLRNLVIEIFGLRERRDISYPIISCL